MGREFIGECSTSGEDPELDNLICTSTPCGGWPHTCLM